MSKFSEMKERYSELQYNPFAAPLGTYLKTVYPELRGLVVGGLVKIGDDERAEITAAQMDLMCRYTLLMYQRHDDSVSHKDFNKRREYVAATLLDFGYSKAAVSEVDAWADTGAEPWVNSVTYCTKLLDPNSFAMWVSLKATYSNMLAAMATNPMFSEDPVKLLTLQQKLVEQVDSVVSKLAAMEKSMFGSKEMARAAMAGEMLDEYYAEQNLETFDNDKKFKP